MKRKGIFLLAVVILVALWPPMPVSAASALYEYREWTSLAKGVTYELNRQVTDAGLLDVHVLTVPLNDPYIYVGPVESQKELGLKETAKDLLSASKAVAGVNGDFFGLVGTYSVPFGPVAADGQLKSISSDVNASANEFAALFLDNNNPFMWYLQADIRFYCFDVEVAEVSAYNKVGHDFEWPVIVDRIAMKDTAGLDARFKGLQKAVVENGVITRLTTAGETVTVPEDGFVLIIPARLFEKYRYSMWEGAKAKYTITNNIGVDFSRIKSSIGGGGMILSSGQTVHDKGTVITGRQPRTAVGISRDKKTMILMTVDGRTHSVGATHDEMAALMLKYGAYDAMHLDGGGSSTMVAKDPDSGVYSVLNTVSDGAQRRIINALGVFDRSPVGEMKNLNVGLSQTHTFVGAPVTAEVYGQDAYLHRVDLPPDAAVKLSAGPGAGEWEGHTYIPTQAGVYQIEAQYGDYFAYRTLYVHDISELQCEQTAIKTLENQVTALSFSGVAADGTQVPANNAVSVSVFPPNLGLVDNGQFIAKAPGAGYLACAVNGVYTFVPLTVGGYSWPISAFGDSSSLSFSGYPTYVNGAVERQSTATRLITRLDYQFTAGGDTQAAYVNFIPTVTLPVQTVALRMNVFGDGSGNWLRARVTDAKGQTHNIDFSLCVDFTEWRSVTALLPTDAPGPFTLDRVYMAALGSDQDQSHSVFFDYLEALYTPDFTPVVPQGKKFADPLRMDLSGAAGMGVFDFTVPSGQGNAYTAAAYGNAAVITLSAAKGGLYATDARQWAQLVPDITRINPKQIIILMDANPMQFKQAKEFELFHKTLAAQLKNEGRTIFVISSGGTETVCTMKDGVRYIQMASDGAAATIRFWLDGNTARFDTGH